MFVNFVVGIAVPTGWFWINSIDFKWTEWKGSLNVIKRIAVAHNLFIELDRRNGCIALRKSNGLKFFGGPWGWNS